MAFEFVSEGYKLNRQLNRWEKYSREDVHGIFSPHTVFTPQAGTWGLQGVVGIPDRSNDFVFFVTYGQSQSGYEFDEGITKDGVLTWQSQPKQGLEEKRIKQWINHDDLINNIYLFLRKNKGDGYTYVGRLAYITHDAEREKPVWFQFQIIDFNLPTEESWILSEGKTQEIPHSSTVITEPPKFVLRKRTKPASASNIAVNTQQFLSVKSPNYAEKDAKNRKLGLLGEKLCLKAEEKRLNKIGRKDLAVKIVHVSDVVGDGAGYDILSFNDDGTPLLIEVKTTRGSEKTAFYLSANELAFSAANNTNFKLIRIYNFDENTMSGDYYELNGDLSNSVNLEPTTYRVKP